MANGNGQANSMVREGKGSEKKTQERNRLPVEKWDREERRAEEMRRAEQ